MSVDNGRRIIDQDPTLTINPEDYIIIDSGTNGSRKILYSDLCTAVAATLNIADISAKANGAMQKTTYDADNDGIVDNAEKLENHAADYFATASALTTLAADIASALAAKMTRSTYDSDNDGIVDNAEKVNNHTVETDVPSGAVFTDTVYDDSAVRGMIGDLTALDTEEKNNLVGAINEEKARTTAAETANANALQDYKDLLGLTVDEEGYICQTI